MSLYYRQINFVWLGDLDHVNVLPKNMTHDIFVDLIPTIAGLMRYGLSRSEARESKKSLNSDLRGTRAWHKEKLKKKGKNG